MVLKSEAGVLVCPKCGFNFVKIDEITSKDGIVENDDVRAEAISIKGLKDISFNGNESLKHTHRYERGSILEIILKYECENCEGGEIYLTFHKGQTLTNIE